MHFLVEAVQGKMEVYLDGGVRKGTDVLKALALGARAVFVGRPVIWGLASQGVFIFLILAVVMATLSHPDSTIARWNSSFSSSNTSLTPSSPYTKSITQHCAITTASMRKMNTPCMLVPKSLADQQTQLWLRVQEPSVHLFLS